MLVKRLILESKPVNLYGYTIIIYGAACGFGFVINALTKDSKPGVLTVVAITMLVPLLSYLHRFYRCRNNKSVRKRLEETDSADEAMSLVFGGTFYGLSTLVVMGATFYLSLKALVL